MKVSRSAFIALLAGSTNAHQAPRVLSDEAPIPAEFSFSIQRIESNDPLAKSSKTSKSSKAENRVKELEEMFPCLGPLVNQTVVDNYAEKDSTSIQNQGLISEVIGKEAGAGTTLRVKYEQGITKSEMIKLCVTKCEEVEEDCTTFLMREGTNSQGETDFRCKFYNDNSTAAQYDVKNPVISLSERGEFFNYSVFHKGDELLLPAHKGCDVPVGKALKIPITCRALQYVKDAADFWPPIPGFPLSENNCSQVLESLASDFEDYIAPSVNCTYSEFAAAAIDPSKPGVEIGAGFAGLDACLTCLEKAGGNCATDSFCGEDNVITKTCPAATCTLDGQNGQECGTCGDKCPSQCLAEIQTAMLCQAGAKAVWNEEEQLGSCLHADVDGFANYLADGGNGDYKCLNETAVPNWVV
mmetsp:Transcript_32618/g.78990  ORF Transcript_32618/g.78990 Transcript_32618/m.78990 type:complete len:412 (-) Transcript_32618:176-1411(-)